MFYYGDICLGKEVSGLDRWAVSAGVEKRIGVEDTSSVLVWGVIVLDGGCSSVMMIYITL